MKTHTPTLTSIITIIYFLLAIFYFTPCEVPHKLVFPLAFLTVCSLRLTPWPMMLAMGFSALGDLMGTCHNFWGQMGFFALAHIAYILFFSYSCKQSKTTDKAILRYSIVALYGLVVGTLILRNIHGVLQVGVLAYIILIITMLILAWMQQNRYYAIGAWLFVLSDSVLAWNKFVSHIEGASYLIMIPYYLAQWTLFIQVIRSGIDYKRKKA